MDATVAADYEQRPVTASCHRRRPPSDHCRRCPQTECLHRATQRITMGSIRAMSKWKSRSGQKVSFWNGCFSNTKEQDHDTTILDVRCTGRYGGRAACRPARADDKKDGAKAKKARKAVAARKKKDGAKAQKAKKAVAAGKKKRAKARGRLPAYFASVVDDGQKEKIYKIQAKYRDAARRTWSASKS